MSAGKRYSQFLRRPLAVATTTTDVEPRCTQRGYPGAKTSCGVWQQIINQIPPHDVFIEAFAGTAAITRRKRPARSTIVIDNDPAVCEQLRHAFAARTEDNTAQRKLEMLGLLSAGVHVVHGDAISWLEKERQHFNEHYVVYCDPPYPYEARDSRARQRYLHELGSDWIHADLLAVLSRLTTQGVSVLLSGYRCKLYDDALRSWRRVDYTAQTRGGGRTESLWCNFEAPTELHDYRWLGRNFRERERIRKKLRRWVRMLKAMPSLERAAIVEACIDARGDDRGVPGPIANGVEAKEF